MRRPKVKSAVAGLLTATCLVGLSFEASGQLGGATVSTTGRPVKLTGADLVSYSSCTQMLQQVKAEAVKEVGPYGLVFPGQDYATSSASAAQGMASASDAASSATSGAGQGGYSTTNDQEAGVDEPDMVKTDGQIMAVLRQQPIGIQVIDVSGPVPQIDGFLPLPQLASSDGLFLVGQDVVVVGAAFGGPRPYGFTDGGAVAVPTSTDVVVVSVVDPANPVVKRTFTFQGEERGARLVDGQVVLALTNQPRLRWTYPMSAAPAAEKAATTANRAVIESSDASDWLPSVTVRPGRGSSASSTTRTASCSKTLHTVINAGLGTLSVVSFDPVSNAPGNEVTVMGDADNVYASATQVFVATTAWPDQVGWGCSPLAGEACPLTAADGAGPIANASTDIYGFDISGPAAPQYLGSGSVPGTLIGQYAMSEYDGYLRVATTVGEPTPAPVDGEAVPAQLSDNMVSVLQPQDGALVTVGSLHGLGEGEKIYAVRFMGDLAYVVTFDQTDPLFVLDLSKPGQPVLAGQVSLSGYSSLLQPLSAGLLLGVGQSVDQQLRTQGLQVEVFNVADPSRPSLVSRQQLGDGAGSAAEYDPHALLWWPRDNLLVMPVDNYSGSGPSSVADVWSVNPSGTLEQVGTLSQPGSEQDGYPEIEREVVVGGDLYTLSEQGVMVNDLSSLSQVAWLGYQNASS